MSFADLGGDDDDLQQDALQPWNQWWNSLMPLYTNEDILECTYFFTHIVPSLSIWEN